MKFIKGFLSFFTTITTAITAVVGACCLMGGVESCPPYIALQILGAGAVTALITAAVYSFEFKSKKHFIIMTAVHYVLLCVVMNVISIMFGWTSADIGGIAMMCICVAIVYAIVYTITYILTKKEADELNTALNDRNKK